jgi:hypothetical protein
MTQIDALRDLRERFIFQGGSKFARSLANKLELVDKLQIEVTARVEENARLHSLISLLRKRCEAAEVIVDMALRGWKISPHMAKEEAWRTAKRAHEEAK